MKIWNCIYLLNIWFLRFTLQERESVLLLSEEDLKFFLSLRQLVERENIYFQILVCLFLCICASFSISSLFYDRLRLQRGQPYFSFSSFLFCVGDDSNLFLLRAQQWIERKQAKKKRAQSEVPRLRRQSYFLSLLSLFFSFFLAHENSISRSTLARAEIPTLSRVAFEWMAQDQLISNQNVNNKTLSHISFLAEIHSIGARERASITDDEASGSYSRALAGRGRGEKCQGSLTSTSLERKTCLYLKKKEWDLAITLAQMAKWMGVKWSGEEKWTTIFSWYSVDSLYSHRDYERFFFSSSSFCCCHLSLLLRYLSFFIALPHHRRHGTHKAKKKRKKKSFPDRVDIRHRLERRGEQRTAWKKWNEHTKDDKNYCWIL